MNKLTAEQRLTKARIALMRHPKFALFSSMLTIGKCEVNDEVPTACTNGRDERWGRKFIETLSDKELSFVVLHECLHKVYRHMFVYRALHKENPMRANAACDFVINLELTKCDPNGEVIQMPSSALLDEKYDGMNSKQVYDLLKKDCKTITINGFDEHDWEGAEELSEEDKAILKQEIDSALRQGKIAASKMAGNEKGTISLKIDELLAPKVDWRDELRTLARQVTRGNDTSSWAKINRRMLGHGYYMPSMVTERVNSIALFFDTSGSISREFLTSFMSEAVGLMNDLNPLKVYIGYWDTEVEQFEEYEGEYSDVIVQSTSPKGGGGTSPECVLSYMKENHINPDVTLILTDGCIDDWGSGWQRTIWCILDNDEVYAPEGKTVHIRSDEG